MSGRKDSRAIVLAALLGTGCTTLGTFETAHAIGAGRSQLSVEAGATGAGDQVGQQYLPSIAVSYRRGLTPRTEVGLRFSGLGADLLGKVVLHQWPGRLCLSLAPSIGATYLGQSDVWLDAQAPLLVGLPVGRGELVLAPTVHYLSLFNFQRPTFSIGGSIGWAVRLTPTIQLLPEVTALHPLGSPTWVVQGGAGLLFGGE